VKLSLHSDDMILYIERTSPKQLLDLINKFRKVAGYKINIQNLVTCLHTKKSEVRKTISVIVKKKISVNLTKKSMLWKL
jgi:hypothetical protein